MFLHTLAFGLALCLGAGAATSGDSAALVAQAAGAGQAAAGRPGRFGVP